MIETTREQIAAAAALVAIQVVHVLTPTSAAPENAFGYLSGSAALFASVAALVGLVKHREWARRLLGITGAAIAIGFVLLHLVPVRNFLTDPYVGRDPAVPALQWAVIFGAMAIGAWSVLASSRTGSRRSVPA